MTSSNTFSSVVTELGIEQACLRSINFSWKRAHYRAVFNWLKYVPRCNSSSLDQVQGYTEAFHHLCQMEHWEAASKILFLRLSELNNEQLGLQLGYWGHHRERVKYYQQILGKVGSQVDAICLSSLGTANRFLGYITESKDCLSKAAELFLAIGNKERNAWTFQELGLLEADQGNTSDARAYFHKALVLFKELNNLQGIALTLNDIARVEASRGNFEEAIIKYQESFKIYDSGLEDKTGQAWVLYNFGQVLAGQKNYVAARKYEKQGLKLFRELENKIGIAWSLYGLGLLMLNLRKISSAFVYFQEGLNLFREMDNKSGIAWSLHTIGRATFRQAKYELSKKYWRESLALHHESNNLVGIAFVLEDFAHLASIQVELTQVERAVRLFRAAQTLREAIELPIPPADQEDYEHSLSILSKRLGVEDFASAWSSGQSMPIDEAITTALGVGT